MSRRLILASAALSLTLAFAAAACGGDDSSASDLLGQIKDKGTITVST